MKNELQRWQAIEAAVDRLEDDEVQAGPASAAQGEDGKPPPGAILLSPGLSGSPIDQPVEQRFAELMGKALDPQRRLGLEKGDEVGAYRLGEVIGEGGMGTVFEAHRADGSFQQQVALKVLHRSPADENARRRFLQERQILASLRHPHIARLLDGGVVRDMPYLVLEHLDGPPLTDYCEQYGLSHEQRLRLVLQVCDAMRYAHRQGVVHRDLKPSNLLVEQGPDGEARVAVLDFGIALVEHTEVAVTATGQVFGTPGYMAPEQCLGSRDQVDRRSDVFALGVVLYELLSGRRPFAGDSQQEVQQRVLEGELTPLKRRVPGISTDLATIVETCIQREPERRYDSVRALMEDLESYLDGGPIMARPQGWWQRWLRRARQRPRSAALVLGALSLAAASLILLTWMALRYTRDLQVERNRAVLARQEAESLLQFMLEDLHQGLEKVGRLDLLSQVAVRSLRYYDRQPASSDSAQLLSRARARHNAGLVLDASGEIDAAIEAFEQNRRLFTTLLSEETDARWQLELARSHQQLAGIYDARGENEASVREAAAALAITSDLGLRSPVPQGWEPLHFDTLRIYAWVQRVAGNLDEAIQRSREAVRFAHQRTEALAAVEADDTAQLRDWEHRHAVALSYLGLAAGVTGDLEQALSNFEQARVLCAGLVDHDPANIQWRQELQLVYSRLGYAALDSGDIDRAAKAFEQAQLQAELMVQREPGNTNWQRELAVTHSALAGIYRQRGQLPQALASIQASLTNSRAALRRDPGSPGAANDLAWDLLDLGRIQQDMGQAQLARGSWREALTAMEPTRGLDPEISYYLDTEVQILLELGEIEAARPLVQRLRAAGWQSSDFEAMCAKHGL